MKPCTLLSAAALGLPLFAAACSEKPSAPAPSGAAPLARAAAPATGNVIEVRMATDEKGNYFEPARISARPGDVLRFVLVSGVHNASFPSDRNAGRSALPEATAYLGTAGRTADVTVPAAPGEYGFQCDPHAPLGMVGTVTVQ